MTAQVVDYSQRPAAGYVHSFDSAIATIDLTYYTARA